MTRATIRAAATALAATSVATWAVTGSADTPPPPPKLELPLACVVGSSCFVQQYPDHDAGPGAKDYRCGQRSYDGHDGLDIRLPTIAAQRRGVAVLAAAPGIVATTRDDMADVILDRGDLSSIKDRECGNGVVVRHGGGWVTQYCHMARGSIAVRPGQAVAAGARLGLVGLSGNTEFPHLHLSLRNGDAKVDPFAPSLAPNSCGAGGGTAAWSAAAARALAYRATEILNAGFAAGAVTQDAIEQETVDRPTASSPLVFYGRAIGLQGGDVVRITLRRADGGVIATSDSAIDRPKAQWLAFAGKKRPPEGWGVRDFAGEVAVIRAGKIVASRTATLRL